MRVLGIDPGLTGGAAVIVSGDDLDGHARLYGAIDLPTAGEGHRRRIDPFALRDWIIAARPDIGFIERAGYHPQQGGASGFIYGRAVGALETCVRLCNVPLHVVEPQVWKRYFELPGVAKVGAARSKELARQMVLNGLSDAHKYLKLKKDHGLAEACLIAMFGADMIERGEVDLRKECAQQNEAQDIVASARKLNSSQYDLL